MKHIKWISAGGTISCVNTENGLAPHSDENSARRMLEIISPDAEVSAECLMNIDSTDLCADGLRKMGKAIDAAINEGFDGIVLTHGTDTMAYACAVLEKMVDHPPLPVIVTGSQRPFFAENSDGPANLANAFRAAAAESASGVFLLFGDKLIRGGSAHKNYTRSDNAFVCVDGSAGSVKDGKITFPLAQTGEYRFRPDFDPKVMLIKLTPFTDEKLLSDALSSGIKKAVIEGFGLGGIPSRLLGIVKNAAEKGVKIMLISQCLYEGVDLSVYQVGRNAESCGIISGGKMCAEAALAEMMFMN